MTSILANAGDMTPTAWTAMSAGFIAMSGAIGILYRQLSAFMERQIDKQDKKIEELKKEMGELDGKLDAAQQAKHEAELKAAAADTDKRIAQIAALAPCGLADCPKRSSFSLSHDPET